VSNVPADNRFSPADRAALARRLCEVLAMEDGDEIPLVHRDAHVRSAAGAIGCGFEDLRTSEQAELAGLCDQFATTVRGEVCAGVLEEDPDKAGTIVTVDGVNDLAADRHRPRPPQRHDRRPSRRRPLPPPGRRSLRAGPAMTNVRPDRCPRRQQPVTAAGAPAGR